MSNNNSSSMSHISLPYYEKIIECVALAVILVASTILNITTCTIIARNKLLRTRPANVFVANLCLSNMGLTWFVMPFSLATLLWNKHGAYSGPACTFNGFFSVASCSAIVLTLCCISIDRYIAVNKPTRYRAVMTTKRALYMLTFTWFQSLLFASFPVLGWSHYEYHPGTLHCSPSFTSNCSLYVFLSMLGFVIPIVVMIITYIKIFHVIRKHSRIVTSLKMTSHTPISPNPNTLVEELQRKKAHSRDSQRSLLGFHNGQNEIMSGNDPPLSPSSIITINNEDEGVSQLSFKERDARDPISDSYAIYEELKPSENLEMTAGPFSTDDQSKERHKTAMVGSNSKYRSDGALTFQKTHFTFNVRGKANRKAIRIVPKEYKIAKTGLLLLILFLALWLPYLVVNSCSTNIQAPERVFHFAMCLVYMNGVANPIAYAFNNAIVKAKLKQIFWKVFRPFSHS